MVFPVTWSYHHFVVKNQDWGRGCFICVVYGTFQPFNGQYSTAAPGLQQYTPISVVLFTLGCDGVCSLCFLESFWDYRLFCPTSRENYLLFKAFEIISLIPRAIISSLNNKVDYSVIRINERVHHVLAPYFLECAFILNPWPRIESFLQELFIPHLHWKVGRNWVVGTWNFKPREERTVCKESWFWSIVF